MDATGRVVILNGTTSAGKSTLADSFCRRRAARGELWLRVALDDYIGKMPPEFLDIAGSKGRSSSEGLRFVETDNGIAIRAGAMAQRVFAAYRRTVATWARQGLDVIVDEVVFEPRAVHDWTRALGDLPALWAAVHCSPAIAAQREVARGDRIIGLAASQAPVVHQYVTYDVEIDTTHAMPESCAAALDSAVAAFAPFRQRAANL